MSACYIPDLPDAVEKPVCVHSTHSTMLLRWKYPFDDGVVVDNFEVRVVQLPDALMALAQESEEADRAEEAALTDTAAPSGGSVAAVRRRGSFDRIARETLSRSGHEGFSLDDLVPTVHSVGHRCEYIVSGSVAYTAFRLSVRAHTMVGWGPWGKWALATTKCKCACTPFQPFSPAMLLWPYDCSSCNCYVYIVRIVCCVAYR
jgi:hypothetical protein